jgi:hypothetical protein
MKGTMRASSRLFSAMLVFSLMFLTFRLFACTQSCSPTVEDKASIYIKKVLPLDFERYNITYVSYELPESPNATYRTEAVTFRLNSSESLLAVNCLFRNGVQYTCDMRAIKGSPIYSEIYLNLVDAAKSILENHQAQTGVDSTELLRMLDMVKSTEKFGTVTQGTVTLTVSLGHIPTGLKMVNGFLHVAPTKTIGITSFLWDCGVDGADHVYVSIGFDDGIFHGLRDERILSNLNNSRGETELQQETAISSLAPFAAATAIGAVVVVGVVFHFKKRGNSTRINSVSTNSSSTN